MKSFFNKMKFFVMEEHLIELSLLIFLLFLVGLNDLSMFLSTSFYVFLSICQGISDETSNLFHLQSSEDKELFHLVDKALRLKETRITI